MNSLVEARGVSKVYGNSVVLRNVSFTIERGSIVGLIGPNGAGKTTTLRSILGLTSYEGHLTVVGKNPRRGRHRIMERVCFIADVGILPGWLKVSDALDYLSYVHPKFNRQKACAILSATDIPASSLVKELSKGMLTQVHLAFVMAIEVDLLVLDEPTLGLDIIYRKTFYQNLLNDYCDRETTVIISTHQVEEVETILTHLLFLDEGTIILDSRMDQLPDLFKEVLVSSEDFEKAEALGPIYSRECLGKRAMIFEHTPMPILAEFGQVQTPSVADLFMAKRERAE